MASRSYSAAWEQVRRLFERGSVGGLSEWQLLDRYTTRRDEAAFEALVARHGPMVLGVCRRVLHDPHAVEDAFQATFLVLVRKAASLGPRDAIGPWLYGVACRVALHARSAAARRHALEVQAGGAAAETPARGEEPGGDELRSILDEELARLPAKYRAPVVLCYLEGLTHDEAARQLRWPIGSVKGRLARAKDLLRGRLARRGVLPAAGALAVALGHEASAAIPETLRLATLRAALGVSAGAVAAGAVSASILEMMEGGLSAMLLSKLKVAAIMLGLGACLAFGAWELAPSSPARQAQAGEAPPSTDRAEARTPAAWLRRLEEQSDPKGVAESRAILEKLEKPISMSFANETPLEDVLKYIKSATQSRNDTGIPIYVDPVGLNEAEKTMTSPVQLDLEGVPLKTTLRLLLKQLGLTYWVKDGLLMITSESSEDSPTASPILTLAERAVLGELSLQEMEELNELFRARKEILRHMSALDSKDPDASGVVSEAAEEQRNGLTLSALEKPVSLHFVGTPIQEAIKEIRKATVGPGLPQGVPVYLTQWAIGADVKVWIDVKELKLKTALRLMLGGSGMSYAVDDGLLILARSGSPELNVTTGGRPQPRPSR
jgi:RNA polymerase sigma factor (sigma-70 family)